MNLKKSNSDNLSVPELVLAAIGVILLFVPIFMLQVHPDVPWVQDYLSGGRVLAVWFIGFAALISIEKFIRKRQGREWHLIKFDNEDDGN